MNETTKMILVLVIISILSAIALSITYESTIDTIEERKAAELKAALNEVFPSESFEEIEIPEELSKRNVKRMFQAKDGLVVLIEQPGFQSNILVLIGIDLVKMQVTNIKILDHLETPGLGSRIEEAEFLSQFKNKKLEQQEFDAITGATISSTAVINAVMSASVGIIKSVIGEEDSTGEENSITPEIIPLEPIVDVVEETNEPTHTKTDTETDDMPIDDEELKKQIIESLTKKQESIE